MRVFGAVAAELGEASAQLDEKAVRAAWERLDASRRPARERVLARAASGELAAEAALARLDALRSLERVAYHGWRIVHHLRRVAAPADAPAEAPEDRPPHAEAEAPE